MPRSSVRGSAGYKWISFASFQIHVDSIRLVEAGYLPDRPQQAHLISARTSGACGVARNVAAAFGGTSSDERRTSYCIASSRTRRIDDGYRWTPPPGHPRADSSRCTDGMEIARTAMKANIYYFGDDGFIGQSRRR